MTLRTFGELEERIMGVLWRRSAPATVREVHTELTKSTQLAYTTVMTVMERLWRKGLLGRSARGRAFEYSPIQSEGEYTAELMNALLKRTRDKRTALTHFVRGMRRSDEAELLKLAERARDQRRGR